ncbi:MAG: hypothetical protein ACI9IP_000646 [Arcticibacterium sp.]|jgi:hypothetical protein
MLKAFLFMFLAISAMGQTSNLPLVIIETGGLEIQDQPKIPAQMKIINNESGRMNNLNDSPEFEGRIGIEFRGSSSQSFPKKPYGLETWDENNMDLDTTLFGWPSESDWILFASFNEKSLMHNVLTMRLAEQMGLYASRTKYVELYLNGSYEGVYVFMEKIKRNKGRVAIAKLKPDEESGEDLTGGYIIKIDKGTGANNGTWFSEFSNISPGNNSTEFFYEYPKEATSVQQDYIKRYIGDFEKALQSDDFTDPLQGYQQYIDMESFVLMTILNEVAKNVDGYRISTYLYKDKGDKLKMGPPWDYDISYGNANYCNGNSFRGFGYDFNRICPDDNLLVPFWWERFLADVNFIEAFRQTYDDLRTNGVLQESEILGLVDGLTKELQTAQVRNFTKWPILGKYVWPQPEPIASSWQGEVAELKAWIPERLRWLDDNIPRELQILATEESLNFKVKAYPNPFLETLSLQIDALEAGEAQVTLTDLLGREIENRTYSVNEGRNQLNIKFPDNQSSQTIQLLKVRVGDKQVLQKVVRR